MERHQHTCSDLHFDDLDLDVFLFDKDIYYTSFFDIFVYDIIKFVIQQSMKCYMVTSLLKSICCNIL